MSMTQTFDRLIEDARCSLALQKKLDVGELLEALQAAHKKSLDEETVYLGSYQFGDPVRLTAALTDLIAQAKALAEPRKSGDTRSVEDLLTLLRDEVNRAERCLAQYGA